MDIAAALPIATSTPLELGALASDRAVYSDLNPRDGGQSLYPMCTVIYFVSSIDKTNYDAAIDSMKGSNTKWIEIALKIA